VTVGDANQRVVGVIGDTTVDVVMEVGDYDDVSASHTHLAPSWQLVDVVDCCAPIHQGNPDDEEEVVMVVNDASDDVKEGVGPFHDNNNHDNNHQGGMTGVEMIQVDTSHMDIAHVGMSHVDIAHVGMTLVENNHVGMEDEVRVVDGPTWIDVVTWLDVAT